MQTTAELDTTGRMKRQVRRRPSMLEGPVSIAALRSPLRGLPQSPRFSSSNAFMRSMQRRPRRSNL